MAYFNAGRCEICGVELRKRPGTAGRPARFCSGTCRQRARRRRMAAEKVTATHTLTARLPVVGEGTVRHGPAGWPDGRPYPEAAGPRATGTNHTGPIMPVTAAAQTEGDGADALPQAPPTTEPPAPAEPAAEPQAATDPHPDAAPDSGGPAPLWPSHPGGHAAGTTAGETAAAPDPDEPRYPPPADRDRPGYGTPPAAVGLPAPLDVFVGREDEIAELKALLGVARLVTLVGPAGTGKTRLALELAARVATGHPDGVWLVELSGLTDDRRLAHHVAESLGVRPAAGTTAERALLARLRAGRTLLVLDTCEHLVDAAARLAVTLLRACPGLTVLATSRRPLDAPGEHLYPVHGLSLPQPRAPRSRGELLRSDAVRLFVERVRAVSPGFELTRENGDEIAEICARLDGNPLALELAARIARLRPVGHILARLDDRLHLLNQGARTAEPRHRNLRTAIAWSYDLLDPDEQRMFRRLSVLAGWFTADDARRVCGDDLTTDAALHLLGRLESSSLLATEPGRPGGRFRIMESIRLYAQERLAAEGEEDDAHERLAAWLLELAAPVAGDGRLLRSVRELDPLAAAHHTLRHALDRAMRRGDDRRLPLATALACGLWHLGRIGEARRVLGAVLARTEPTSPGRAAALGCAAVLAVLDGDGEQALDLATRALEPAHDPITRARALLALQTVRRCLGDLAEADRLAEDCLALLDEAADPADRAVVLHERARLAVRRGDLDGARALLDRCLAAHADRAARRGRPYGEAEPVPVDWAHTAATVALLEGDIDDAARRWREILDAYRPPGGEASPLVLECVAGLAAVAARTGDALRAVRLAAAAGVLREGPLLRGGTIPREALAEAVTGARAALSAAAASAAIRDGERLGGPDLIGYALGGAWREPGDGDAADPVLTDRERQVALLVAEGLANRQIARRLHVSERTVHTHLERIRAKLGLPSRAHIVRWVLEEGTTD
ncbi:hypothetical protein GCM10010106_46620 [Thermopolyspora flexuosa]|jgi:non-specific serine/threonine protein kinase|nr:hypothetical protein GCM10010106_46620 [Thermopolyspora flexuosa]